MSANTPRPRPAKKAAAPKSRKAAPKSRKAGAKPGAKTSWRDMTRKEWALKTLKWGSIVGLVMAVLMVSIFYFAYRATEIPSPNAAYQAQTTKVFYNNGKDEVGSFATQNRVSLPLAEIPKNMQEAVVAAEDRSFWTNNGIDIKGIIRAARSNAQGNSTQGASTITQQYVKLLYLTPERTIKRKIKEAILSLKIQKEQSKSEILEGYLNTVYFGRGAYGVQAAANAFFGIQAKQLNTKQAALLAAVLNSPNYLSPEKDGTVPSQLLGRYQYVVSSLLATGKITSEVANQISTKPPRVIKLRTSNSNGGQKGFMLDMVKDELLALGFEENQIEQGGLRVTTTFQQKAMDAARDAVAEQRPEGLGDKQLHVATASVDVKTGGLVGFYAGQDYLKSQINWAKYGGPPGSTFKAFAIAAGLQDGFSLKDTFDGNSPYRIGGIDFNNQGEGRGRSYGSRISLLTAAENSVNTAFVDLTQAMDNGPRKIIDTATALGIPANAPGLDANLGVALGSATIGPMSMANAYASIADGGVAHELHVIAKVTRASGEVLYQNKDEGKQAIPEDVAADTSFALQNVVKNGTGRRAKLSDRDVAGKTGTATNDDGDVVSSWFVGFTPQVATAVMYVRGKGSGALQGYMPTFYGGEYPARTFQDLMTRVMDGLEVEKFPDPANLDGDAPKNGHEPARPTPTRRPTPRPTPTPTPTAPPTPTLPPATPTETSDPTGQPSSTCGLLNPNPCGPGNGNGNGNG